MCTCRIGSTLEVAATPARLGKVGHGVAVERAGTGHALERGARQGQHAAAQMDTSQPGIGIA